MDEDEETPGVPELDIARGGRLSSALAATVQAIGPGDRDAGLVALLAAYARELDGADALAARARKVAEDVREQAPDGALDERVRALETAVSKRSALVQIGSRFHAGLTELLATPKARGRSAKSDGDEPPAPSPAVDDGNPLHRMRLVSGDEG